MAKVKSRAECLDCNKIWDKKNALMVGKVHHKKYGHDVVWEVNMKGLWKAEGPKENPNALIPDWDERQKKNGKGT